MNGFLLFTIGCFVGGFVGTATMCLLQISRTDKDKEDADEKEN